MFTALERLGIDKHSIDVLKNCYKHPTVFVQDDYSKSATKRQHSGIRQGCPISPYFFVLVMACIDHDVRLEVGQEARDNRFPRMDFDSTYHADDTILEEEEEE